VSIEALVISEAMNHIEAFGFVRNMDPMALHILKTSEQPGVVAFRNWMRRTALEQVQEAEKTQPKLNAQVDAIQRNKCSPIRLCASLHPYYARQMALTHSASWNDKDFIGSVREANPKIFPKRDK
jgi:hypothetical protein